MKHFITLEAIHAEDLTQVQAGSDNDADIGPGGVSRPLYGVARPLYGIIIRPPKKLL